MGELTERAFTEQRLLDAWSDVRDAALADGEAGAEVERFEAAAARHVSELAAALSAGTFQPHPVARVEIAKRGGGVRRLAVPSLADRIVERALLAELDAVIDPLLLPWSFAYRHGLGVRDAVACLAEARDAGAAWACTRAARCRRCCPTCTSTASTARCSSEATGRSGIPTTSRSRSPTAVPPNGRSRTSPGNWPTWG